MVIKLQVLLRKLQCEAALISFSCCLKGGTCVGALRCPYLAPFRPHTDDCDSSRLAAVDCTVIESFNRALCAHLSVFLGTCSASGWRYVDLLRLIPLQKGYFQLVMKFFTQYNDVYICIYSYTIQYCMVVHFNAPSALLLAR